MDPLLPYHCTLKSSGHCVCTWEYQTANTLLVPLEPSQLSRGRGDRLCNQDQLPLVHLQLGLPGMVEFGQVRSCMSLRR